jgi:hypothetical protein
MIKSLHKFFCTVFLTGIIIIASATNINAALGDTTIVNGFQNLLHQNCNDGQSTFLFPPDSISYYKIMLKYQLTCPPGIGCDIYDRIATLKVLKPTGTFDSLSNEILEPFEIARAITPYGEAVTVWFDVSDYRPLLHDSVILYSRVCGYSNGWNVTTDFYFIEGIPPMHPFKVANLWNGTWRYGDTNDPIDTHLLPLTVIRDSQSVYEKVRLITTGHGFGGYPNGNVAEFYNVTHILNINGSNLSQHLWRGNCGINPLYPQGAPGGYYSTWYLNRANWCPGSYVTPHDFDASLLTTPGGSYTVDYNMYPYTVTGGPSGFYHPEYYIQSQTVSYDNIEYTNNVALLEVRRPNGAFEYNRMNPVCQAVSPQVLIKNYGTLPLTQLTFNYGVDGLMTGTYTWNGSLAFLDTISVNLPAVSYLGGSHSFEVYADQPNGSADEFTFDDTLRTAFSASNSYNVNYIRIQIKTDQYPTQVAWNVKDDQGVVVASRNNFTLANSVYNDTVYLANGCYTVNAIDAGGDGMCCFYGSGYFRLFRGNSPSIVANIGDYGASYSHTLTIDFQTAIDEVEEQSFFLYPNPASQEVTLNTSFESGKIIVSISDFSGREIMANQELEVFGYNTLIRLPELSSGLYLVKVSGGSRVMVRKLMVR